MGEIENNIVDIINQRTQEKEQEELEFKRSIIKSYLACEFLTRFEIDSRSYTLKKSSWNLDYLQSLIKKYEIILHPAYVKIDSGAFISLKQDNGDKLELVSYRLDDKYGGNTQFFLIPADKRLWPDYLLDKDNSEVIFV